MRKSRSKMDKAMGAFSIWLYFRFLKIFRADRWSD